MKKFHFLGVRNQPIIQASVRPSAGRLSAGPRHVFPRVWGAARADETR